MTSDLDNFRVLIIGGGRYSDAPREDKLTLLMIREQVTVDWPSPRDSRRYQHISLPVFFLALNLLTLQPRPGYPTPYSNATANMISTSRPGTGVRRRLLLHHSWETNTKVIQNPQACYCTGEPSTSRTSSRRISGPGSRSPASIRTTR